MRNVVALCATTCEAAVGRLGGDVAEGTKNALRESEISVEVDGRSATAEVGGGSNVVLLEKDGDRWVITQGVFLDPG
jgi:hypothetical protein